MRTVKTPHERREEFLDAARALFQERGVDATAVNDIIEKVGVAKGTFYWHFKSKEALLDALAQQEIDRLLDAVQPLLEENRNAVETLRDILAVHDGRCRDNASLRKHFHKPENLLLHQKHRFLERRKLQPLLAAILAQGVREGVFTTASPETAAEFLLLAEELLNHPSQDLDAADAAKRRNAIQEFLEHGLGATPGTLGFLTRR